MIVGLPEQEGEVVTEKVNNVINEGLDINDITVAEAVRKNGRNGKPGVVIAKCRAVTDKIRIMKSKSALNRSARYKQVRIYHDKPKFERDLEANLRLVVSTIGKDKLVMRGPRVVPRIDVPAAPPAGGQVNVRGRGGHGNRGHGNRGRGAPRRGGANINS